MIKNIKKDKRSGEQWGDILYGLVKEDLSERAEGVEVASPADILGGRQWEGVLQEAGTARAKALRGNMLSLFKLLKEDQRGQNRGSSRE